MLVTAVQTISNKNRVISFEGLQLHTLKGFSSHATLCLHLFVRKSLRLPFCGFMVLHDGPTTNYWSLSLECRLFIDIHVWSIAHYPKIFAQLDLFGKRKTLLTCLVTASSDSSLEKFSLNWERSLLIFSFL